MSAPEFPALRANEYRDAWCGQVLGDRVDTEARVAGWVHRRRDHGGLIFIDLRDRSGLLQLVFRPEEAPEAHAAAVHPAGDAGGGPGPVGGQLAAPGVAVLVGARRPVHSAWRPFSTPATTPERSTFSSCPESMSRSTVPSG